MEDNMATKNATEVKNDINGDENSRGQNKPNSKKENKGPGFFAFLLPILLVISIIFGIWTYFLKTNKFGLGESFRPVLKDIPIVRMVLPPNPDPEAAEYMSNDELAKKYELYKKQLKELKKQTEDQKKLIAELQKYKDNEQKMRNEVSQQKANNDKEKKKIEAERKQLQKDKLKFAEDLKNGDKDKFAEYYERMDKDIAKQIYEKVLKEKQVDEEVKNYVKTFEGMEPANAAKVLEHMGLGNMDLVANIMKMMKRQSTSEIIANMDPVFAANLADRIAVEYPIYPEEY